jgi:hypothetical protein
MKKQIICGACGSVNTVEPNADFTDLKVSDVEISEKLKAMAKEPIIPQAVSVNNSKDPSWLVKIFRKEAAAAPGDQK